MPRDTTRGYTVLAITSFALLGSVLGKPFVRSQRLVPQGSHTESKLLFWITKLPLRNTATVSEETQLGVCKTIGFSKEQNWAFTCMPHADSLLPLCAIITSGLESPGLLQRRTLIPALLQKQFQIHAMLYSTLLLSAAFPSCARSSWSLCYGCDTGADKPGKYFTHTHALSKPDIRCLEINSVKRFGKFIVHAKTFKRHPGSSKSLKSLPFFFFTLFLTVELRLLQNGLFLFLVDQNEGNLSSAYISRC